MSSDYKDSQWLEKKYHNEGLTQEEIAEQCGVQRTTITRWMKKHGIDSRGPGCSQAEGRYKNKDWLRKKYWDEELTVDEIGEECGVSGQTINYWRDKHGIDARDSSEAVALQWEDNDERREKASEHINEVREQSPPEHIRTGEHRPETIEKMSEAKVGDENPMWRGGYEGEYGHTWPRKRKAALERDGYECQACGSDEELHVHHHRPVRTFENPNDAHFLENLVTVCVECHPTQERLSRRHTFVRDVQL